MQHRVREVFENAIPYCHTQQQPHHIHLGVWLLVRRPLIFLSYCAVCSKMEVYKLKQEMKRHAVLVVLAAHHSDLEIANFLKVAKSFVYRVQAELMCCGGDVASVAKSKMHSQPCDIVRSP